MSDQQPSIFKTISDGHHKAKVADQFISSIGRLGINLTKLAVNSLSYVWMVLLFHSQGIRVIGIGRSLLTAFLLQMTASGMQSLGGTVFTLLFATACVIHRIRAELIYRKSPDDHTLDMGIPWVMHLPVRMSGNFMVYWLNPLLILLIGWAWKTITEFTSPSSSPDPFAYVIMGSSAALWISQAIRSHKRVHAAMDRTDNRVEAESDATSSQVTSQQQETHTVKLATGRRNSNNQTSWKLSEVTAKDCQNKPLSR